MLLRTNGCTCFGYCAFSWVRRSGGTDSKYQSSWPSAISFTDCSGVTPICDVDAVEVAVGRVRCPDLKFGLRRIVIDCCGMYLVIR